MSDAVVTFSIAIRMKIVSITNVTINEFCVMLTVDIFHGMVQEVGHQDPINGTGTEQREC